MFGIFRGWNLICLSMIYFNHLHIAYGILASEFNCSFAIYFFSLAVDQMSEMTCILLGFTK